MYNSKYLARQFIGGFQKGSSTIVEKSLQNDPFFQNEPNFTKCLNEVMANKYKDLRKFCSLMQGQKRSQTKPNEANLSLRERIQ